MLRRIGVIAGMRGELDALGPWRHDQRVMMAVSGARPGKAETEARRLIDHGCELLVSWGLAGGLDPSLAPGRLVTATGVIEESGAQGPLVTPRHPGARAGLVLGSDRVVRTAEDKKARATISGAIIVDMETHRIARAAAETNVPVAAVRAVADPAHRTLPGIVEGVLTPEGVPRISRVLWGILTRPRELPDLIQAKRDSDAALAALSDGGRQILEAIVNGDRAEP